jgi:signal transduction histidine kinase
VDGIQVDGDGPTALADARHGFTRESEIVLETDRGERHFHLNVSPLEDQGQELGQLVVLRDVTALKAHQADLELLKQLFGRVLRHNVRNDLNVVRAHGRALAERDDEEVSEVGRLIAEKSTGIVDLSEKAREIEQLVEADRRTTTLDLGSTVEDTVDTHRSLHPEVDFEVSIQRACTVHVAPTLEVAIENLVENAAQHNEGPDQRVAVAVECTASEAVVRIEDDGPGILDQELEVLERRAETQLRHGSGIGLWFVDWAVRESRAAIDYDTGPDGTTITLTIPR